MMDREAQAKLREAEIEKYPDLRQAMDAFNKGNLDKMTPEQVKLATSVIEADVKNAQLRVTELTTHVDKMRATLLLGEKDTPEIAAAEKDLKDATDDLEEATQRHESLTGHTPGVKFANAIIRTGYLNKPWPEINDAIMKGTFNIPDPDDPNKTRTITLNLTDAQKETAKAVAWDALSPAQQAAWKPVRIKAPNGDIKLITPDQVDAAKAAGGVVVQ
jgi:hypothetical protein